jgi:hypothetical protein
MKHGAIVVNRCDVTKLNKGPNGKINGARITVKDNLSGEEWNIHTKVGLLPLFLRPLSELISDLCPGSHSNATGPFS